MPLFLALPTVILNSPAVSDPARGGDNPSFGTGADIVGIIFFAIGLAVEALADIQKVRSSRIRNNGQHANFVPCFDYRLQYRYKSTHPPKGKPCTAGVWKWSR